MLDSLKKHIPASSEEYLFTIYSELVAFAGRHYRIFTDKDAISVYYSAFYEKHKLLRIQLAELILPIISYSSNFEAEFIAESMLTWTMAGKDFDEIYSIIKKIII